MSPDLQTLIGVRDPRTAAATFDMCEPHLK
jgi:hypothetical protein